MCLQYRQAGWGLRTTTKCPCHVMPCHVASSRKIKFYRCEEGNRRPSFLRISDAEAHQAPVPHGPLLTSCS